MTGLVSYSQFAKELGVDRKTVADLVRVLGITPAYNPASAMHLGLTGADQAKIRKALRFPARPAKAS